MRDTPRIRRLRTDLRALERLAKQSTILDFSASMQHRGLPEAYLVRFRGRGLWRPEGSSEVALREHHEVGIQLGAAYPRMMPELSWKTPIFHPNISSSGIVCLGGYGTHWVPSLNLDELCTMLWDMVRYKNYDVESPYNREAALWAKTQRTYRLPLDSRPIRDQVIRSADPGPAPSQPPVVASQAVGTQSADPPEVLFLDDSDNIVDAEVVEPEDPDILFIE